MVVWHIHIHSLRQTHQAFSIILYSTSLISVNTYNNIAGPSQSLPLAPHAFEIRT